MTGLYKFNTNDCFTSFGLVFEKGTYDELLKLPKVKDGYTKNWPDENGTERDLTARYFESIPVNLPVVILGTSQADIITKYNALANFLMTSGYFNFDVKRLNRRFILLYQDMTQFSKLTKFYQGNKPAARLVLSLINDFPTTNTPIPA